MRYLGIDLHKTMFVVCFLVEDGGVHFETFQMNQLNSFLEKLFKTDLVAIEATGNSKWFAKQLQAHVMEIKIVNPAKFKIISNSVKKSDKTDAEALATFLSKDLLPESRVKDDLSAQLASLANTRDKLVKSRTVLKNKLHNILNSNGIQSKREIFSSEKGLKKIEQTEFPSITKVEVKVIVDSIRSLNQSIKALEDEMNDKGKTLKGYEGITSIKGIGSKSGTILLSIIGNINDFENEKKLSSYFGLVPRMHQSNETVHYGRITKMGSKLGRSTLVQCTLIAIRYSEYLRTFYNRLKAKKGSGKAIIATARKLLTIIYNTLKNNWVFDDFKTFTLKTT